MTGIRQLNQFSKVRNKILECNSCLNAKYFQQIFHIGVLALQGGFADATFTHSIQAMSRKWKILCLVLFFGNLFAFRWLVETKFEVSELEDRIANDRFGEGMRDAEANFKIGKLRVYEFELLEEPPLPHVVLTNKFTGEMDGPFELWLWRCYKSEKRFDIRLQKTYVDTYNQRIEILHRRNPSVQNTNEPPMEQGDGSFTELYQPRAGLIVAASTPKKSYQFAYELRVASRRLRDWIP